jgi:RNA polymerase sigma-70 factor (ECF subfamily)
MIDRLVLTANGLEKADGSPTGVVMNSLEDLIARARDGDQAAFGLLFERHARPVLGFLYNQIGSRDVAEELTQETFVRAYRGLAHFRDQARFSTWLFGIAKNVAREWKRSVDGGRLRPVKNRPAANATSSPADELLGKELSSILESALQSLDEDRRVVFGLKVIQQCSYHEIVEITGFSLAKVKIELHRARAEMRIRLHAYLEANR